MAMFPWFTSDVWTPVVKALAHTLWQGALVAAVLYAILKAIPAARSEARYGACLGALLALVLSGFTTWAILEYKSIAPGEKERELVFVTATGNGEEPVGAAVGGLGTGPGGSTAGASEKTTAAEHRGIDYAALIPWAAALWFLGVTLMIARVIVSVIGAGRLRRECRPACDPAIEVLLNRLRGTLRIGRRVRVAMSEHVNVPAVIGVIWPTILLPASMLSGVTPDHLRAIIAHELAHIRRYDYLVNLAQMVIEALLFFNPMVWWISRRVRIEREACCDALAAEITGDKIEYARALSAVAATLAPPAFAMQSVQAMTGPSESRGLLDRVKRILVPGHQPHLHLPWYAIAAVLMASAVTLAGIMAGSRASVKLAADILTPEERIEKIKEIGETHKQPAGKPNREYSFPADGITVSGVVQTADGSPLPHVTVRATSRRPGHSGSYALGGRDGRFSKKLGYGKVHIRANAEGYAPAFAGPLEAEPGGTIEGVVLTLDRGFTGRVRILDESGEPLADTAVGGKYEHIQAYPAVEALTDSDGLAVFEHCSTVPIKLSVGASGYQTDTRIFALDPDKVIDWKLKKSKPATGIVVSQETGKPIMDAELYLIKIAGPDGMSWGLDTAQSIAATDENGRFVLDRLRDDSMYTFFVDAPGYGRNFLRRVMAGKNDIKVELGPELYVRGKVIGDLDKLQKHRDAMSVNYVNPYSIDGDGSTYSNHEWQAVELRGDEAYFEIRDLIAGRLDVYAGKKKVTIDLDKPVDDFVIDLSERDSGPDTANSDQKSTRAVVVRFEVPEGSPFPTGEMTLSYLDTSGQYNAKELIKAPIENGIARTVVPVPTRVGYETKGLVGFWIKEEWGKDAQPAEEPYELTVKAIPAGAIYGTVGEADGSPAKGSFVGVLVVERSPLMEQGSLNVEIKDSHGGDDDLFTKFMASPLPLGGKYAIILYRDQSYAVSEPVELTEAEPMKEINLRYKPGVTVRGQILTPDGKPAAGVRFRLSYSSSHSHSYGGGELWADAEGRFELDAVNPDAPGTYAITIRDNPGVRPARQEFKTDGKPLKIQLERGHELRGVVVDDKTGWPVPGIEVYAMSRDYKVRDVGGYIDADEKTNDRGEFKFSIMGPIEYGLNVRGGNATPASSDLTVTGGQSEPVTLRVNLAEWSKLKPRNPDGAGE